jgi:preprotein translocase subunit SecA
VQLIGGIILHEGKIAEMKTGEGKTLVAILPTYINALEGKGVHVITVNDYLASRDAEYVGQVHKFLGLSVGLVQENMQPKERQLNYSKDITYVTNSELGFDYLRDNMVKSIQNIVLRPFSFSILDEIDSILIDEARTPLIISGSMETSNTKYIKTAELALILSKNIDYDVDEKAKSISLSEKGIIKSETWLCSEDLFSVQDPWASYVFNALKAKEFFLKDVNYIVKNGEIIIVDEFTGRIMSGRRWSNGLHQAIESKEGVPIRNESQVLASITYQNLFLLYPKLSGMTGTAKTEETELDKIYGVEVVCVPTHRKMIRKDFPDLIYKNQYIKWKAIANECVNMHLLGRPVLIGTTSIEKSETLSAILKDYKIPHNLLNAKPENVEREAEIISQAGKIGAITIATNMAGRGTDVLLGGNANYMAKSILKTYVTSIITNETPKKNITESGLEKLYEFLKSKIIEMDKKNFEIEKSLFIACENVFTEDENTILLRGAYLTLVSKYTEEISQERKKVIALGGLHVIGTEKHESRRIDNQLRGRSGRQGDPGSSRFFLSLDDNLLRIFGGDKIKELMESMQFNEETPIESNLLSKSLESAQKKVEMYYYDARKQLFEYDEVLNYQREAIYSERKRILESTNLRYWVLDYIYSTISDYLDEYSQKRNNSPVELNKVLDKIDSMLGKSTQLNRSILLQYTRKELEEFVYKQASLLYEIRENQVEHMKNGLMQEAEKSFLLETIDAAWKEHLQRINNLRENIGWRGYGQKDPLIEYKNEAYDMFLSMIKDITHSIVFFVFQTEKNPKVPL